MTGSKKISSERSAILAALKQQPKDGHYVWDGQSEDDRPATTSELVAARSESRKRGRPAVTVKRPMLSMRTDPDVLAYLRGTGKGWQTRVNALLREAVAKGKL